MSSAMPVASCAMLFAVVAFAATTAVAQAPLPPVPVVAVTASATSSLPNDRMHAWLRVEADNPDPGAAANEVNTRMAKALTRAKGVRGVDASTTAYSSYQISERNQPSRWRVSQTLALEGADFFALAALISKIQSDDGLVLSGMNFAVSPAARRAAEDALTQQAIKAWQARAQAAAQGFGSAGWRPGHVSIQTGDFVRPPPVPMRMADAQASAPIAAEAGNSEITVTVTGDAILEPARALR